MGLWEDSPYTGIFTRLGKISPRPHDPDVPIWSGTLAPWGARSEELPVGGAGWDDDAARQATIGEGVERLQPYPLPCDQAVESSFDGWRLDEPPVEPERWVLFHPKQYDSPDFPFKPLTRATRCRWVAFRRAVTGDPWWVPAEIAYLFLPRGSTHTLCPGVSTGLSCGRAGQPVLLRGLQEVIERDAVVGAWWRSYGLEEWPAEQVLSSLEPSLISRLLRPGLRYRFFRVDSPFSAHVTIVCLEGEEREGFCFGIGSACREARRDSWLKSTLEAVHGYQYVRHLKEDRKDEPGPGKPASFKDHALFYALYPERLSGTVLCRPSTPVPSKEAPEGMSTLIERLGRNRPVLFRIMTPAPIASEVGEWHVLKVIVPGLQPLHGDHSFPHLGGSLWAPRGLEEYASTPPHPFP